MIQQGSSVQQEAVLDEVEADTYYCISRLLDGIQVGVRRGGEK